MKCFYHNSVNAIAICKNCNRGVCQDCASEVTNGIACKNRCESEVESVNNLINRSKGSYQKASYAYTRNSIIYLLIGLICIAYGLYTHRTDSVLAWYLVPIGIVFLLGALFNYSSSKKYSNDNS